MLCSDLQLTKLRPTALTVQTYTLKVQIYNPQVQVYTCNVQIYSP